MDARNAGFGYAVPMPRFFSCLPGDIVYIDEQGVIRTTGSVFADDHFQTLVDKSQYEMDRTTTVEEYPSRTVALTTGCIFVTPLTENEVCTYVIPLRRFLIRRSIVLTDSIVPQRTELKALCGWRLNRLDGEYGLANAIILGPHLTKTRLNIHQSLIDQWVREAPCKTSLWPSKVRRRLPKLLVVLEQWTSSTWTYIASDENESNPGPCAVGLTTSIEGATPEWKFLAIPQETLSAPMRLGNTAVTIR